MKREAVIVLVCLEFGVGVFVGYALARLIDVWRELKKSGQEELLR